MIMDIKKIVNFLRFNYQANRQAGHTTAIMQGANNTEYPVIIAVDHDHSRSLKNICKNKDVITLPLSIITEQLRGRKSPILFDNYTLQVLFDEIDKEFGRLQTIINHHEYGFASEDRRFIERVVAIVESEKRKDLEKKIEKIKEIIND